MLAKVLHDYSAFFACEIDCHEGDLYPVIDVDDRWVTVRFDGKKWRKTGQIPLRIVDVFDERAQTCDQSDQRQLGSIPVTDHDLNTLAPTEWLNDEIVNGVFSIISCSRPRLFAFSSFFYTKLCREGYAAIRRWTKTVLFQPRLSYHNRQSD